MTVNNKILILSNICIGGVETFSIYLAQELKKRGYDIIFINQNEIKRTDSRFSLSLEETLVSNGIKIISIEDSLSNTYFNSSSKFIIPFYADQYLKLYYQQITLKGIMPELYGYIHSDGAYYYDNAFLYESITSKFICVSETIKINLSNIINEKDKLIYKKCPLLIKDENKNISPTENNHLNLLFVGRITDKPKGVFKLVEIVRYLENNHISFTLNVVGNGTDLPELKNKLERINSSSTINFITNADTPDRVKTYYKISDILLILSSFEGGPLVLYEAMEFGVIPLAFNVGVVPQIVEEGKSGYIFDNQDTLSVAKKIKSLSTNKNILHLKHNAKNKISSLNMSLDNYCDFLEDLFMSSTVSYIDVAVRKTNSKIQWKKNDIKSWVKKIVSEDVLKRNNIIHYLDNNILKTNLNELEETKNHYKKVYEDMPLIWKKMGAILRKMRANGN